MFSAWTFFIIIICAILIRYRVLKIYTMGRIIKFNVLLWTATEGWDAWSSWSLCDADGMQVRRRRCTIGDLDHVPAPGLCQGRSQEERVCISNFEGIVKLVIQTCVIYNIRRLCLPKLIDWYYCSGRLLNWQLKLRFWFYLRVDLILDAMIVISWTTEHRLNWLTLWQVI